MKRFLTGILVLACCGACKKTNAPAPDASVKPPAVAAPDRKISLLVRSRTWREGEKPYDIAGFATDSLGKARIAVVPETDAGTEAVLLIEHSETRGHGYSRSFYEGVRTLYGTNVVSTFTLLNLKGDILLRVSVYRGTPSGFDYPNPYGEAVDSLLTSPITARLGRLIRAGLGSGEALRGLLPDALDAELTPVVKSLITRLNYSPESPADRAWIAAMNEDFNELRALGPVAVNPLIAYLERANRVNQAKAAAVLAEIGDARAAKPVVDAAVAYDSFSTDEEKRAQLKLMEATGRLGDAFSIRRLEELIEAKDDGSNSGPPAEMRDAARRALAEIRARLAAKPKS